MRCRVRDHVPDIDTLIVEVPAPDGPFGAKGIAEAPVIPAGAAVASAIAAAGGPRLREMPMTATRVWAAIQGAPTRRRADGRSMVAASDCPTHPGAVIHYWDHLVITLRATRPAAETGFLSLYAITYSASLGAGHVAIVETAAHPVGPGGHGARRSPTTSGSGSASRTGSRAMGDERGASAAGPPRLARFERNRTSRWVRVPDHVTTSTEIEARWEDARPAVLGGRSGRRLQRHRGHLGACSSGRRRASLTIDGVEVPGAPFDDDVWHAQARAVAQLRPRRVRRGRGWHRSVVVPLEAIRPDLDDDLPAVRDDGLPVGLDRCSAAMYLRHSVERAASAPRRPR